MENPAFDVAALLAPPDILKSKCALCIQPHPDDNEIGMGGTVAVLAQAGCTVHYLTVTNGDQGNKNRTASPQETARVRRAEAIAAGTHLGAKEFHFLDHGDGTLDDVLGLSAQIARVIRAFSAKLVVDNAVSVIQKQCLLLFPFLAHSRHINPPFQLKIEKTTGKIH